MPDTKKLCPMRKQIESSPSDYGMSASAEEFLPCLGEKCAWWVEGGQWRCCAIPKIANAIIEITRRGE